MNIRELRRAKGLTQAQLAESAGVTKVSVCKWEAGLTVPRAELFQCLRMPWDVPSTPSMAGSRPGQRRRMPAEGGGKSSVVPDWTPCMCGHIMRTPETFVWIYPMGAGFVRMYGLFDDSKC